MCNAQFTGSVHHTRHFHRSVQREICFISCYLGQSDRQFHCSTPSAPPQDFFEQQDNELGPFALTATPQIPISSHKYLCLLKFVYR